MCLKTVILGIVVQAFNQKRIDVLKIKIKKRIRIVMELKSKTINVEETIVTKLLTISFQLKRLGRIFV